MVPSAFLSIKYCVFLADNQAGLPCQTASPITIGQKTRRPVSTAFRRIIGLITGVIEMTEAAGTRAAVCLAIVLTLPIMVSEMRLQTLLLNPGLRGRCLVITPVQGIVLLPLIARLTIPTVKTFILAVITAIRTIIAPIRTVKAAAPASVTIFQVIIRAEPTPIRILPIIMGATARTDAILQAGSGAVLLPFLNPVLRLFLLYCLGLSGLSILIVLTFQGRFDHIPGESQVTHPGVAQKQNRNSRQYDPQRFHRSPPFPHSIFRR